MITLLLLILAADDDLFVRHRFTQLPDWAQGHAEAMQVKEAPPNTDVWCLLNETVLGFDTDGNLMVRNRTVQAVLRQGGAEMASYSAEGVSEDVGSVLRISGWHLPRSGAVQKVDQDDMVTYGTSRQGMINRQSVTTTGFQFVSKGSIVVFESVKKEKHYLGAVGYYPMLSAFPTKEYRLKLVEEGGNGEHVRLIVRGTKDWGIRTQQLENELVAYNLPPLLDVPLRATFMNYYPFITAQFLATEEDRQRYQDWDHYARWYWSVFKEVAYDKGVPEQGPVSREQLLRMGQPLRERVTYQQVYLSNARGFVPVNGAEVIRRAYGDCKDMASCFAYMGQTEKVLVLPTLANIVTGPFYSRKDQPYPMFNHLISAVPLTESLGLAAEVVVNKQRYLIFDSTSSDTAFGYMPRGYLDRSVLICTPKGAIWVDIPESALEPGSITYSLKGDLDAEHNFRGSLTLRETGNANSFRSILRHYGQQNLTRQVKTGMPPLVEISLQSANCDEQGEVVVSWDLYWPNFLQQSGPGLHLPEMILPRFDETLRVNTRPREMPILIPDTPPTTWNLDLGGTPLVAHEASADHKAPNWWYHWQATAGDRLKIQFQWALRQSIYSHTQTGTGVKDWYAFRDTYQKFRRESTLLVTGSN